MKQTIMLGLLAVLANTASASPIKTFDIDFSLTPTTSGFAPSPLVGSLTLALDLGTYVADSTTGLTVHSLNFPGVALHYTYNEMADQLWIGGSANSPTSLIAGTDDVFLFFLNLQTSPLFAGGFITNVAETSTSGLAGDVQVSAQTGAAPVPAVWALLCVGLIGAGLVRRKH